MTRFDLLVRGGAVVTPDGVGIADIAVSDGEIVEVSPEITGTAREEIDARGLHVLPGAVDVHVHFNEPGRTDWEGWATGSAACAVGGTTTVAEMPLNAHPPTLDGPSFDAKRQAAEASSRRRFRPLGRADAHQPGAHGGAGGARRHRFQGVHVELRHRRFPGGRRRHAVRRDATCGGARAAGRRARGERRAHRGTGGAGRSRQGGPALATTSPRGRQSPRSRRSPAPSSSPKRPAVPCMSSTSAPAAASPRSPPLAPVGST